jgi:hypothetical protein
MVCSSDFRPLRAPCKEALQGKLFGIQGCCCLGFRVAAVWDSGLLLFGIQGCCCLGFRVAAVWDSGLLLLWFWQGKADEWKRVWNLKPSMALELYLQLAAIMKVGHQLSISCMLLGRHNQGPEWVALMYGSA